MEFDKSKYLDLGSVVILKNGIKSLTIVGYCQNDKDYLGVIYPEGMIMKENVFSFNHNDIEKILFNGFHSPISETFLKVFPDHVKNDKYSRIQLLNIKNHRKYLPIGTVVFLNKAIISYIIIGYVTKDNDTNYIGLCYPVGMDVREGIIIFSHDDISTIRYIGYKNENYIEFNKLLNKERNNYKF